MHPTITIISATHNAAASLYQMLESVAQQTYGNFELIIQDGASTDNTVGLVKTYQNKISRLTVASEADYGIYDAWNKALIKANGEWVIFLGDGDILINAYTLEQAAIYLANAPADSLFAIGGLKQVLDNGKLIGMHNTNPQLITKKLSYKMPVHFPAIFFKRKVFEERRFDNTFKIAGDYELFVSVWNENKAIELPIMITQMVLGGLSTLAENRLKLLREEMVICQRYFNGKKVAHRYLKAYFQHFLNILLGKKSNIIINKLRYLKFRITSS